MPDNGIINFIKDLVHPVMCTACGKNDQEYLCSHCRDKILSLDTNRCCLYCGTLLPIIGSDEKICRSCRESAYNFTRHRSFTIYSGIMKKIIKRFKYEKIYGLDEVFAGFLYKIYSKYFKMEQIDYIETVPGIHTIKIAKRFSKIVKIPFKGNIIKIRDTKRQTGLDLDARRINILDAFKLKDCLIYRNKNILIIDDVWTTGSTLKEICRIMRNVGVKKVFLSTLARGA